ncbi:MAG: hypothetical protein WA323_03860, partial [Candidatus Nitrosopolaris sp.]
MLSQPMLIYPMLIQPTLIYPMLIQPMLIYPMLIQPMLIYPMLIQPMLRHDNPLSGIKLCNVEADNRIIFQNAKPTSASPSSIATDTTTRPIVKESADRPSIHKMTRYTSDGKPINQ